MMSGKFKEAIKRIIPSAIIYCIKSIRHLIKLGASKQQIKHLLKERKNIYLEIGAGSKKGGNGWVTLDISPGCDIYWDLSKGLPFPDNSIQKLYSCHVFEHFSFDDAEKLFDECLRVMIPGGIFSICVPNAKLFIDAYYGAEQQANADQLIAHKPAYNNVSRLDYINYIAYMDGHHKYMFDEENLVKRLMAKGFNNVHLRDYDPKLDLLKRDFESIYAEGQK